MSTLFDDLVDGSDDIYFGDLNAAPAGGSSPTITSVGTLRYLGSATIVGTNFGASQGAGGVLIGGVVQPVTSWSDTSIVIGPIARGTMRYGTQAVIVVSDADGFSTPSAQTFLPQTGWSAVTLTNPLATSGQRITATSDAAPGDQYAWGDVTPSGTVTVNADGSFTTSGPVGQFSVECNDGTGWGGFGTQSVANVEAFSGTLFASPASFQGSFAVQVPSTDRTFSGSLLAGAATMAGTFLAFTGKQFTGTLVVGAATLQGAFNVLGAVVTPSAPATPSPGTGTPAAKVAIVNLGLICLGVSTIRSFTDDSKAARIASQLFDHVRDRELAKYIWKFALARRNVPEYISDEPRGSYRYSYAKPVDWLATVWLGTLKLGTAEAANEVHCADWSHEGEYILTNIAPPMPLQYIRRLTDPTKYDVLFNTALSKALAMEMADALTDSTTKWEKARAEYKDAVAEARRGNAILDPPRTQSADTWLDARL
jgi:hypothetical protein